jgi:hypothetical protein
LSWVVLILFLMVKQIWGCDDVKKVSMLYLEATL